MILSNEIIRGAQEIASLEQNGERTITLPVSIPNSPKFFLADKEDKTIHTFGAITQGGKVFKIGIKKGQQVSES